MKRFALKAITVSLMSLCAVPVIQAQSATDEDQSSQKSSKAAQETLSSQKHQESGPIRASKLIGVSVTSKDGESLGQVQDLVFDPNTGKIRFALVGKGFMSGAGATIYPMPWQAINVQSEKQFVMNVDKSKLSSMPLWSQTEIEQPDYTLRIFRFYNLNPESESAVGGPSSGEQGTGSASSDASEHKSSSGHEQSQDKPTNQDKE